MTDTIAYKAFDQDMKCRGFQYEVGKTYEHEGEVEVCGSGFHACEYPLDVLSYYPPTSRFARVELAGKQDKCKNDTKIAADSITITAEVQINELIQSAVQWVMDRAKPTKASHSTKDKAHSSATGHRGAASATGDQGAASATGHWGAASATGDRGAASATGYQGAASATGDQGAASATGDQGAAMACGYQGTALASEGNAIFLAERNDDYEIIAVWSGIAGKDGVKPDTWYTLRDGELTEVDAQ